MNELSAEYIKAAELDRRIKTSAQLAQQSLYDMCMGFKEMRDSRLYKELGYSDFGDYCEKETGFSKMNVYRYISIAENLPQDFVTSRLQIGVKKLTLLAKLSDEERTELAENIDLESTTVKELKAKIDILQNERDSIISAFRRGDITVLCNVDLISEGFDVPDCECAILLRPTKSLTLYIQQAMRCMRYRPDKRAVIIDHVGNYARFGMPDDDREWSLEKKPKAQHKKQEQSDKVKQCPECFYTFSAPPAGVKVCCPHCGYEFPSAERKLETDSSVGLVKVEGFKLDFSSPADCHTYPELLQYAKSHGYKSGWAYYQARQRGLIG